MIKRIKITPRHGLILFIVLLFSSWYLFDLGQYITLAEIKSFQRSSTDYIDRNLISSSLIFLLAYVVITGFSLPGAVFLTLLGGALFGFGVGLLIISFASTIGATLAFLVSRYLLQNWVQTKFGSRLETVNEGIRKDGIFYLFSLRLIPVFPFFLINLLMGLTKINARTFYWVSQVGMLPGTAVYVLAGTQLSDIDSLASIASPPILVSLALLGIFPWIAKAFMAVLKHKKIYRKWTRPKQFDRNLVVIGAGAGGLVSAYIAAAVKAKVTLVEKHKMGGDCLNTGCVPSKALIRSAHTMAEIRRAPEFGIDAEIRSLDFNKAMQRIKKVITDIEPHDSVARYTELGVECLSGEATIQDPWHVKIGEQILSTRNIVIATGAGPVVPEIPGLETVPYLTSDTLWQLESQPETLLIMGGGPIGCEIAQSFARLGSRVIQVEIAAHLLVREDVDASVIIHNELIADGVSVKLSTSVDRFQMTEQGPTATLSTGEEVGFDRVFLALGRRANVTGFGLEELGIEITKQGVISIDDYQQTSIPNIFAVGDVSGPFQLTHVSAHQAWYAAVNALFGRLKRFKTDYRVIPAVTYTYPELARVGINEAEAQRRDIAYQVTKYEINDLDRAITDGVIKGFVKVITEANSDTILGATIVAAQAGELLAEYTLAMKHRLGLNKLLVTVHPYPTMSEANKYAAGVWKRNNAPETLLLWVEKFHQFMRSG